MSLLIDYSRHRADLGSSLNDSNSSLTMNDDSNHSFAGYESFAYCDDGGRSFSKLDESAKTATTTDLSSGSSLDDMPQATETPICFRLKRSSMVAGMGSSSPGTQDEEKEKFMSMSRSERFHDSMSISRSERFHDSKENQKGATERDMSAPYGRQAPARVNSGDSLEVRLQYASWKQKHQNLLSASAEIATSSDGTLFQKPGRRGSITGRRGSMSHLNEGATSRKQDLMGSSEPGKLTRHSMHNVGPSRPVSSRHDALRRRVTTSHINSGPRQAPNSDVDTPGPQKRSSVNNTPLNKIPEASSFKMGSHSSNDGHSSRRASFRQDAKAGRYSRRRGTMSHVNSPSQGSSPRPQKSSSVAEAASKMSQSCHTAGKSSRRAPRSFQRQGTYPSDTGAIPIPSFVAKGRSDDPSGRIKQPMGSTISSQPRRNLLSQSQSFHSSRRATLGQSKYFHSSRRSSMGRSRSFRSSKRASMMGHTKSSKRASMGHSKSFHASSSRRGSMGRSKSFSRLREPLGTGNTNDFVTGSRIRRLDSSQYNGLGYR